MSQEDLEKGSMCSVRLEKGSMCWVRLEKGSMCSVRRPLPRAACATHVLGAAARQPPPSACSNHSAG